MVDDNLTKKIPESEPVEKWKRGRPHVRWEDGKPEDARAIGAGKWRRMTMDRQRWRKKLGKHNHVLMLTTFYKLCSDFGNKLLIAVLVPFSLVLVALASCSS